MAKEAVVKVVVTIVQMAGMGMVMNTVFTGREQMLLVSVQRRNARC